MKPLDPASFVAQHNLFRSLLTQLLDLGHPLVRLAKALDWSGFEKCFGALYVENVGRPGLPTRLMVGLHYLKYAFDESDESVVERWVENPYWQFLCGEEYFQHVFPLDPSSLSRWRDRVGPEGIESLLAETIATAKRMGALTASSMRRVNVDTTVQEKAVAFPTDARLYHKARRTLVREAEQRGVTLRQSYARVGQGALIRQGRYAHARKPALAKKETRKLKTYLGRVIRDLERKVTQPDESLNVLLERARRIHAQKRDDKNKVYSMHAPEVECVAKGKARQKYEFGVKVAVVSTSRDNWVLAADAVPGNPYDGHTLAGALAQAERIGGVAPTEAYVDKGYRGAARSVPLVAVHPPKQGRGLPRSERRWLKRRSAIEPVIGHLKSDCRLDRNHLKGTQGDRINAMLAGAGLNFRKLLRAFLRSLFGRLAGVIFAWFADSPLSSPRHPSSLQAA